MSIILFYFDLQSAFSMQQSPSPQDTLRDIRNMMERSSRFISLSGWSGISAGLFALAGAVAGYYRIRQSDEPIRRSPAYPGTTGHTQLVTDLLLIAGIVFLAAVLSAFLFTLSRSRKNKTAIWDPVSRRLLWNTLVPMLVGGLCLLRLISQNQYGLIAPFCLVFYGLALLNGSKYTLGEIRYLALAELALGITCLYVPGYGLLFWALGFGVLHILYGMLMWWRHER